MRPDLLVALDRVARRYGVRPSDLIRTPDGWDLAVDMLCATAGGEEQMRLAQRGMIGIVGTVSL